MSKTSKIVSFKEGKQLEYGKVYAITFDNGDQGEAIEKAEPVIGATWEYDISETQYGNKIKRVKAGGFQPKGGSYSKEPFEDRVIGFAYSYAKDLYVAGKVENGAKMIATADSLVDAMIATHKRVKS